jgi:putative DNA primase/helicase
MVTDIVRRPQDVQESFAQALRNAGIVPPPEIIADGRLHRFSPTGKRGDDAGWYVLHGDGIPAGAFGDWRSGISQTWRADFGRPLTPAEQAEQRRRIEEARAQAEQERQQRAQQAAALAVAVWKAARPAGADHPYLSRKGVAPTETLRELDAAELARRIGYAPSARGEPLQGRILIAPVRVDGKLSTLELIDEQGRKSALAGGVKRGGYWATAPLPDNGRVVIAEGIATALSIAEALGEPVAAALSVGNLAAAGEAIRAARPDVELVIAADLDKTSGKPHPEACKAAQALGCRLAIPDFGPGRRPEQTDCNDLHAARGLEAVRQAFDEAQGPAVKLLSAADITPEPVTWLWDGWLAAGKLHILGGAPGTGKTTLAMALAATVTTGNRWPDGTRSIAGNVVVWSGEDDPADTLIPRLMLSGADLTRVFFIAGIREGNKRRAFDPARDMELLRRKLADIGDARLLIVDPIVSAIAADSHKNAEVRRGLQPLVDLAVSMRCAVLGITHFSKYTQGLNPVERLTGSLAFGAAARVVMVAAKRQEEGENGRTMRLFCRAKSNIGPDDGGFEYDLHQAELKTHPGIFASCVQWGEAVKGTAQELLATADASGDDGEGSTLANAKRFLADLLADGPLPVKIIRADADGAGYSWATIRRAQKALGVEAVKEGGHFGAVKQQWVWRMPGQEAARAILESARLKMLKNAEDAQEKSLSTFRKIEHLQDNPSAVEVEGGETPSTDVAEVK